MNTLNYQFIREEVPTLIAQLAQDTQPQWGMMTAQHVVEHLSLTFMMSIGRFEVPCVTPPDKLERARAFLMSDKPLQRNAKVKGVLPQDSLMPLRFPDINAAKEILYRSIQSFYTHFEKDEHQELKQMHPVFGELNFEEWLQFHGKHCRHHLTQFGVMRE